MVFAHVKQRLKCGKYKYMEYRSESSAHGTNACFLGTTHAHPGMEDLLHESLSVKHVMFSDVL